MIIRTKNLAPFNKSVTKINSKLVDMMPTSSKLYKSIDTAMSNDEATHYPLEFINSIETSGFPPHKLNIKNWYACNGPPVPEPSTTHERYSMYCYKKLRDVIEVKISA